MPSDNSQPILVTAALPYANGPIHIGHLAGAYLPADMYCRYQRIAGRDIVFICGSDEMGVAIMVRARKDGIEPREIVDRYHPMIVDAFRDFGMSFDHYGRTTSPRHEETSQEFFRTLAGKDAFVTRTEKQLFDPEAGIFLADRFVVGTCPNCDNTDAYGDQCEKCGTALSPLELKDPRSTLSDATPELRETTHWYLPLGNYQDRLKDWIDTKTDWKPNVLGQVKSWLNDGLRDRAITRDVPWGVPVPKDVAEAAGVDAEGKVIYVWFDAPIGYISATREWAEAQGEPERWRRYWQHDPSGEHESPQLLHFIGKDNIVFHCLMFPAMLMEHGDYVLPEHVPANEFLNLEGDKLSTSRGWAVWLHEYLQDLPPDLLRYALATTMPETKDADFSWKDFQLRANSELADVLGNFVHRSLTFANRFFDGAVPELQSPSDLDRSTLEALSNFPEKIGASYEAFRFRDAVFDTMALARLGNKYFNDTEPWKTRKADPAACGNTIHVSLQICASLAVLMDPVLPHTATAIRGMLNLSDVRDGRPGSTGSIGWEAAGSSLLPAGHRVNDPEILFTKIEDDAVEAQVQKLQSVDAAPVSEPYEEKREVIAFDDFLKLDLRAGVILSAEPVPKSKKLLRLEIDLGFEKRQILSGVAQHFSPEDLVGRTVSVVANLAPRKMMGLESQGMVLMAEDRDGSLHLMESTGEPGSVIR